MKRSWLVAVTVVLCLGACLAVPAQKKQIVAGVLPAYDASGQSYGATVAQLLTGLLYQQLAQDARFRPTYINPGGGYDPTGLSLVSEFVETLDTPVDVLLAATFTPPETPKKGDLILHLKVVALDPKTTATLQTFTASTPLKESSAFLDYGKSMISTGYFDSGTVFQPSRQFEKQPLGKAAVELVRQAATSLGQQAATLNASGAAAARGKAKSCKMQLKVNYVERHSISKSYTVFINDRDESLGIKEGILEVEEPASPVLIQLKVNDSPRRMMKQDLYLFDPQLDCSRDSNFLNINLGPAGEASTVWK